MSDPTAETPALTVGVPEGKFCDQCEQKSYADLFRDATPEELAAARGDKPAPLAGKYLSQGWRHFAARAGLVKQCENCVKL